jgi:hypothetical protein
VYEVIHLVVSFRTHQTNGVKSPAIFDRRRYVGRYDAPLFRLVRD